MPLKWLGLHDVKYRAKVEFLTV